MEATPQPDSTAPSEVRPSHACDNHLRMSPKPNGGAQLKERISHLEELA